MAKNLNRPCHRILNLLAVLLFIIATAIVSIFSLIPSSSVGVEMSDKILHFITYGGLTGLLLFAHPSMRLSFVFILISMIGIFLEVAQALLSTGRTASFADQIANSGGAIMIIILWIALSSFIHKIWSHMTGKV